jgi:hypothetical protein
MIAILALTAAVSGVAVAGPVAKKAVTKKKVKKIADKEIAKLAPELSVAHADTAANAANATNAAKATTATNATNAANVNGVTLRRFNFHAAPSPADPIQIFGGGGLTLKAECELVGVTHVFATTSVPNSYLGSDAFLVSAENANDNNINRSPFNPGDTVDLLDQGSLSLVGHTGYFNDNANVQLSWTAHRQGGCDFVGYAAIG